MCVWYQHVCVQCLRCRGSFVRLLVFRFFFLFFLLAGASRSAIQAFKKLLHVWECDCVCVCVYPIERVCLHVWACVCIHNVSWQTPVCKFSGIRYVPLSFLREPHSTDYELCTVLFSYDCMKQSHCTQYENMFTDRVDSDLKSIFLFCFCLNPNIIPNSSILYTALPARWRCP